MSAARTQIFAAIRHRLGGPARDHQAAAARVDARLSERARFPTLARVAGLDRAALTDAMIQRAEAVGAITRRVAAMADMPGAVAALLAEHNLPARARISGDLAGADWASTAIEVQTGKAADADKVSVVRALAGVAETGTVIATSGADRPTTLNFMPETNILVLRSGDITPSYEDAWANIRAAGPPPRTINMITGPSRTGDIEQRIMMGAHGPLRLAIVVVDDS